MHHWDVLKGNLCSWNWCSWICGEIYLLDVLRKLTSFQLGTEPR